jgi:hypothetical protein
MSQGHNVTGRIRSTEKSNDILKNRTRDLLPCSIEPQPSTLPRAPILRKLFNYFSGVYFTNRPERRTGHDIAILR